MKVKNRKGFTLIELIVVIAILGMVITTISGLMFYGFNVYTLTSKDFEVQSEVRVAMEKTNKLVRFSSALFAVPNVTYMDREWNYIGMNADRTEIINYKWDTVSETHTQEVMVGPYSGITFNIGFEKENNLSRDNTLRMYFESFTADGSVKRYDIKSGYEALNSLQVINYGTASNPANALAYREEQYSYENFSLVVNIAMVLDVSGSMGSGLVDPNGNITTNNPSRISVLRTQSKMIVEKFAQNSNSDVAINLSLVPFSTYAKTPSIFYDVKNATQKATLLGKIDAISANGNTNTGDGLRRSYYQLLTKQTNDLATATTDTIVKNYTIILVDGESNHSSMYNTHTDTQVCTRTKNGVCTRWSTQTVWEQHYYEEDQTIGNCTFTSSSTNCTPGFVSSTSAAYEYVGLMGAYISNPDFVSNYLVSFATDVSASQITFLADATQTPTQRVYYATDADQLGLSFTEIQMSITNDLWQFLGPKLSATAN
jgi:prepilin-type N-terminal cleavage/methylation domain-containing protein